MTDPLEVPANDYGTVRVFGLDLGSSDPAAMDPAFLGELLGAQTFSPEKAEIVETTKLGEMLLTGYLTTGYDVPSDALSPDADRLNRPGQVVALVPASAFGGVAQTLHPKPPAHFIGLYHETAAAAHDVMQPVTPTEQPVPSEVPPVETPPAGPRRGMPIIMIGIAILLLALVLLLLF